MLCLAFLMIIYLMISLTFHFTMTKQSVVQRKNFTDIMLSNLMKTDIKEKKDGYELEMDLPGFKKDEITAELKDGYMTISAAKGLDQDEQEKDTGTLHPS